MAESTWSYQGLSSATFWKICSATDCGSSSSRPLGDRALDHVPRDALHGLLLQRVHGGAGRLVGELASHAAPPLRQHRLGVADAQALRDPAAHRTDGAPHSPGRGGQPGLARGQQPIRGFLADLLGLRAGHGQPFTGSPGERGALGPHLPQARCSQEPPANRPATDHGGDRLANAGDHQTGVLHGRDRLVHDTVGFLELPLGFLGGVGVPVVDDLTRLLGTEPDSAAFVLEELAHAATGEDVREAHRGLGNRDGAPSLR
ncbi:hypothetical protein GO496_04325 [Acidovorax citrulli]|nr:hypothetical protein [Paracidovorax citrulli]